MYVCVCVEVWNIIVNEQQLIDLTMSFKKFLQFLMVLAILRYRKEVNCEQDYGDLVNTVGLYYYSPYVLSFAIFIFFIFY